MTTLKIQYVASRILFMRGMKVMLDSDLAELYSVSTTAFNQAVRRNKERFPKEFMFQLSKREIDSLRSQIVISNIGRGGRRYKPYVFTELGIAMLSSVLNSPKAIQVNIIVMRTFVKLRHALTRDKQLAEKIARLENKVDVHDMDIRLILSEIRALFGPSQSTTSTNAMPAIRGFTND